MHSIDTGAYRVTTDVTIGPDYSGNGIRIAKNDNVLLYIDEGKTFTVTGKDAGAGDVGHAAILLQEMHKVNKPSVQAESVQTANTDGTQGLLSAESSNELHAEAEGDVTLDGNGKSGTMELGGKEVAFTVAYYDASGREVDPNAKVSAGQYVAVVSFAYDSTEHVDPNTASGWIIPFAINKIQVDIPTPVALTFECANWQTGEGALQDAFPTLGDEYKFVEGAKKDDGTVSTRSAKSVGEYQACFRLKDPAVYEWAGESEDATEVWVPWSIKRQDFDPNDAQISYWGTSHNKEYLDARYYSRHCRLPPSCSSFCLCQPSINGKITY